MSTAENLSNQNPANENSVGVASPNPEHNGPRPESGIPVSGGIMSQGATDQANTPTSTLAGGAPNSGAANGSGVDWTGPGEDYSAGGNIQDWRVTRGIDVFARRVEHVNRLRSQATYVAMGVLICLLAALGLTVYSFTQQINKVTPAVNEIVKPRPANTQVPPSSIPSSTSAQVGATIVKTANSAPVSNSSPSSPSAVTHSISPGSVTTSVSVDMSSIGNSIVAVVTVLVISIAALVMVLLRTAYALSTNETASDSKKESSSIGIPLPGAEVIKAVAEGMSTVIKSVSKSDK